MAGKDEADGTAQRLTPVVGAPMTSQIVTDVPSARPTSVPDYDAVLMTNSVVSFDPHANAAQAIPKRVPGSDASQLPHAAAFALMHVDGVSSIATIAEVADLPLQDVVMYFLELTALGIVTMGETRPLETIPPESRVKRK